MSIITQPSETSRVFRATAVLVAFHCFLWAVLLLELFWWGPNAEKVLRDLNIKLPALTELVIDLSRWAGSHVLCVGIIVLFLLVVDGIGYFRLRTSVPRFVSKAWFWLMSFLPITFIVGIMIGIMTPLLALHEGLST